MAPFDIANCDSLQKLQEFIDSGEWKDRSDTVNNVFSLYCQLLATGQRYSNFGNIDFWNAIFNDVRDESGDQSGCSSKRITLDELQECVESGIWRGRPLLRDQFFQRYLQLVSGRTATTFGTSEFWSDILPEIENTESVNINPYKLEHNNVDHQTGHGSIGEVDANLEEEADDDSVTIVPSNYYELLPIFTKSSRQFGTNHGQYDMIFKNMQNVRDIELILLAIFTDVLETIKQDGHGSDLLGFFLHHPALDIPIVIPLRRQNEMTAEIIADEICKVLQSKAAMTFDDKMTVHFIRVQRPEGSGRLRRAYNTNIKEYLKNKQAIVEIINADDLCCARAIVTAKARIDQDRYETVRKGERGQNSLQCQRAQELMREANLTDHKGPCGPEEWMALQQALGHGKYQLKIFDKDTFNGLIYAGPDAPNVLHLWLHDQHFDVITKMNAFFETAYYCEHCNKGYTKRIDHQICPVRCSACFGPGKCKTEKRMRECGRCHRFFHNQTCFGNHLRAGKSKNETNNVPICKQLHRCLTCKKEFYTRKGHQCGQRQCPTCKVDVSGPDHQCYIQPYTKKSDEDCNLPVEQSGVPTEPPLEDGDEEPQKKKARREERTTYLFYDLECRQDEIIAENECGDISLHEPNFIVVDKVCDKCADESAVSPCVYCKENHRVFKGDSCLDDFCQWLFSKVNAGSIAIAHNSKGYDGQFILEYCHRQGLKPKQIISRGLGIMYMEIGGIKFKDSLNFLPMALSSLPKAFGITECKKGYFPHMFNRRENWNHVGVWPAVEYYQPQYMKEVERKKFIEWYEQQEDKQFDFQKELLEYCESDVEVLRKCCLKFRRLFMDIGGIDPFAESITIASACNRYYRKHHLPLNRIAVVPHGGYRKQERQSIIGLKWLKWLAHTTGQRIQHKLNGGEVRIGPWRVDGMCGKTVYEFYGCYWHGCPHCMPKRNRATADGEMTASEAYQRTMERRTQLEAQGYTLVEKWQCQLQEELRRNVDMARFFESVKIVDPLDAREAFYGGRTNATVLYHKVSTDEEIRYIDILSLYPFICKYGRFPTGHPTIITENFKTMGLNNMPYEGLVKCTILPPTNLLHPVLPYRCKSNKKLLFPLCASCAATCQQQPCRHTDEERSLSGAWVTLELKKALELGYRILEVFEVWHFEEYEEYNPVTNPGGGLFTAYINDFLRIKQEADGWPPEMNSDEKRRAFLEEWKRREGIELRPDHMTKNAGLRALAKLCLNSFWGKFGQRSKLPKMEYFTDPAAFFKLVFDPATCTKAVRIVNDKMVAVTYDLQDEFVEVLANTNTVIAAYTTAQARLKLYSYIEKLQERVLYFDTDSIIYVDRPGDLYRPPIGNYLGEMTDELAKDYGPGSYVTEFVSGGPKHYAYKVWSTNEQREKVSIKVKGFQVNHTTSAAINFENLVRMVHTYVQNNDRQETNVEIQRIERTGQRTVVTVVRKKLYRVTYDKRIIRPDFSTVPYGFRLL